MENVLGTRRWIVRRKLEGWKAVEIDFALKLSEKTLDRWWRLQKRVADGSSF